MRMDRITSTTNSKVQHIKKLLADKDERYSCRQFVAEGANIVKDIPKSRIVALYMTEDAATKYPEIAAKSQNVCLVADKVIAAISDTKTPSGVVAVCSMDGEPQWTEDGIAIVLDNLRDPGNAGTIIRTAAACGVSKIYVYGDSVDLYSPKVVRSSMGGIFHVSIARLEAAEQLDMPLYALDMNGENLFELEGIPKKLALLVGSESAGVSEANRRAADKIVSIPMSGAMESLNAGVSLSVALYQLVYGNKNR